MNTQNMKYFFTCTFLAGLFWNLLLPSNVFSSDSSATNNVQYKIEASIPNIHFTDSDKRRKFISLLKNEGIPYKIEELDSKKIEYVTWDKKYDTTVQKILWDIKGESPNITFPTHEQNNYFISLLEKENIPFSIIEKETSHGPKTLIEYKAEDASRVNELKFQTINQKLHITNKD